MSTSPTVVVKKGGMLTALVSGIFGTLIVCILCGSALSWYALNMADRKVSDVLGVGHAVIESLPEWCESLPPALAEMLDDHRAPDYLANLDYSVRVVPNKARPGNWLAVVEVANTGDAVVTLVTARIVLLDEDGVPVHEQRTFIATPFTVDEDEWRGPMQPGATRRFAQSLWGVTDEFEPELEITDVRIWDGAAPATASAAETPAP